MAKPQTQFVCQSCGAVFRKWIGKCEECLEWNTLEEEPVQKAIPGGMVHTNKAPQLLFSHIQEHIIDVPRTTSGISELDRVLGGGLVPGAAILIGGDPGIGKSTLLLQLFTAQAKTKTCAYISGEESLSQISLRAHRLGIQENPLELLAATNLSSIITSLEQVPNMAMVVIDSIQTMYIESIASAPGTVSQVRACTHELIRFAKARNMILFIVGHVTKEGQIAGPKVLEHMVDTVLYFEGERGHHFRIIRAVKNRFGAVNEIGVFEMTHQGLSEVVNPSALFLSQSDEPSTGSAVFAGIEGTRPILVEIQALVAPSTMPAPRRAVVGWDHNRLAMILAVLATRYGLNLSDKEVYLNVSGGLKISEPAADLAAAAAIISAAKQIPLSRETVYFGEIVLSGEVRLVGHSDLRIKEAQKLGFKHAMIPASSNKHRSSAMKIDYIDHVASIMKHHPRKENG